MLGNQFETVSSSTDLPTTFTRNPPNLASKFQKSALETETLDTRINNFFSLYELKTDISNTKNTAPGHDRVCYEMFKHLSDHSLQFLLFLFNKLWVTGVVPKPWLHSIVIPVHKQSKPSNLPSSYRPISLTSSACKIMEKMIVNRLKWYLEHYNLRHITQSGFRIRRRVTDHIMRLHDIVGKSLANKHHVLPVFIDIAKAHDMVCTDASFFKLLKMGINGRMFNFIRSFLTNRCFQVRVGSKLFMVKYPTNGIPQGSILRPILFSIVINDLPDGRRSPVALHANDFSFWESGSSIKQLNDLCQRSLAKVAE